MCTMNREQESHSSVKANSSTLSLADEMPRVRRAAAGVDTLMRRAAQDTQLEFRRTKQRRSIYLSEADGVGRKEQGWVGWLEC